VDERSEARKVAGGISGKKWIIFLFLSSVGRKENGFLLGQKLV
jgi:hypothetical protein